MKKDLQLLAYPERDWVRQRSHPSSGAHVYDVIIVGGGQCGLTTAFGLSKEKVRGMADRTAATAFDLGRVKVNLAQNSCTAFGLCKGKVRGRSCMPVTFLRQAPCLFLSWLGGYRVFAATSNNIHHEKTFRLCPWQCMILSKI